MEGSVVLHVATVSAADGILSTLIEPSREALLVRLAEYVRSHAAMMLWPKDADRVLALLAVNRLEEAVDHYFAHVGDRWDREYLDRQVVALAARRS